VVTLIAGVVLERAGEAVASHISMSGVLFGATMLAAATSLPEMFTGLTSTKLGDYRLAVSDIFCGNASVPVLFLLATMASGEAVLPQAHDTDIYLAGRGISLTSVYLAGLILGLSVGSQEWASTRSSSSSSMRWHGRLYAVAWQVFLPFRSWRKAMVDERHVWH
jgi:Ca2+/Na+ antiporter